MYDFERQGYIITILTIQQSKYSDENDQQTQQNSHNHPICEGNKSSTITRLFKNTITNLAYNLKHSNYINTHLLRKKIQLIKDQDPAYLLGKTYHQQNSQAFLEHFRQTIWLSYRKGIKNIGDDTGWGCMIRSAQMMLAQAIKRSTQNKPKDLIKYFQDEENNQLSLLNICRHGKIDNRWATANQIVINIKQIANNIDQIQLMIHSLNQGCLILRNLIEKIKNSKKSHLLVVHNRLGVKKIDELNFPHLKQLMKMKQFAGLLGGQTGQAMYILGYHKDQVIFLDPHYVQDSCSSEIQYFKKSPRGVPMNKLSPCISIAFFVKDENDMRDLIQNLYMMQDYYRSHRVINLILDQQLQGQLEMMTKKDRKISVDDFETIQ